MKKADPFGWFDAPLRAPDECNLEELREPRGDGRLYFMYSNFGRVHQTLRVTPAMEAGIADHVWGIDEIVELLRHD